MALDVSELMGAPQVAGVRVNHRGFGKALMSGGRGGAAAGAGGAVGGAVVGKWARGKAQEEAAEAQASTAPEFGKFAFLAATAAELALVDVDARTISKLTHVLARVPRDQVASVELGKAGPLMAKPLTVTFTNGQRWILEVPALVKRNAKRLVASFG